MRRSLTPTIRPVRLADHPAAWPSPALAFPRSRAALARVHVERAVAVYVGQPRRAVGAVALVERRPERWSEREVAAAPQQAPTRAERPGVEVFRAVAIDVRGGDGRRQAGAWQHTGCVECRLASLTRKDRQDVGETFRSVLPHEHEILDAVAVEVAGVDVDQRSGTCIHWDARIEPRARGAREHSSAAGTGGPPGPGGAYRGAPPPRDRVVVPREPDEREILRMLDGKVRQRIAQRSVAVVDQYHGLAADREALRDDRVQVAVQVSGIIQGRLAGRDELSLRRADVVTMSAGGGGMTTPSARPRTSILVGP